MVVVVEDGEISQQTQKFANFTLKNIGLYPLTLTKCLMQLGFEPMSPSYGRTLLGNQCFFLPNGFKYMNYLSQNFGYSSLYCGFAPIMVGEILKYATASSVKDELDDGEMECVNIIESKLSQCETDCLNTKLYYDVFGFSKDFLSETCGRIISYPLKVIAVRMIADFFCKDGVYTGFGTSVNAIFQNDGILGFFAGLVPALIGTTLAFVTSMCMYVASVKLISKSNNEITDKTKNLIKMFTDISSSFIFYPFQTVSTVMCINQSNLKLSLLSGREGHNNWINCYRYLKSNDRLYRGSTLFNRRLT